MCAPIGGENVRKLDDGMVILSGRRQIFTDVSEITRDNVYHVVMDAMIVHNQNLEEIKYLNDYVRGIQPILNRTKEIRPEINIRTVFNRAAQIVDFKLKYEFGSPITFVQRSKEDGSFGEVDDRAVAKLNELFNYASKPAVDLQIAKNMKTCGVGYRLVEPSSEEGRLFKITSLNPETTFVVYRNDAYREPVLGVTYFQLANGQIRYSAYSKNTRYEFLSPLLDNPEGVEIGTYPNIIGEIPIVEYINDYDRMAAFERVIPLIDALNLANSDRLNDLAQHVQSLLWLDNVDIEDKDLPHLREYGIIKTKSANGVNGRVAYVESLINQGEIQKLVDYINDQIDIIANVPGRQETGGGSTGSAMNLSNGWQAAENDAKGQEVLFTAGERRTLQIVDGIIKNSNNVPEELLNINMMDIDPKFSRNKTYDLATKCSALAALLKVGVDGLTAFTVVGLFTDPQLTWNNSKETVEKIRQSGGKTSQDDVISLVNNTTQQPSKVSNVDEGV